MNEWHEVRLGALAKGIRGVSYRPEHLMDHAADGAVTLLRATNIQQGKLAFDDVQFVRSSIVDQRQVLEHGDIAVCMSNGSKLLVGKAALFRDDNEHPFTVGAFCSIFRPHDREEADFVFHLFGSQTYQKHIDLVLAGSAINNLKNSSIENAVFKVPINKRLRQKIATVLSSIETVIGKTEALIGKYQQIKIGLMQDLFTRGVLPNGQLRPFRDRALDQYKQTAIGWIPKEWELTGLAAKGRPGVSWIRTGPFGSALKGEHWRTHGRPVITIGALSENRFNYDELLFVDTRDAARLVDFQLTPGDVVFSRVADVGRSVVVRDDHAGWIMSSNLMRIAVDEAQVRPDFLQMALAYDVRIKAQIRARVNSGGRDVANSEVLNQLRFVWPSIDEQDRIIERSNLVSRHLEIEQQKAAKLRQKKCGLMHDLLTGGDQGPAFESKTSHA
jgi:type I restriction enzyme S subunit